MENTTGTMEIDNNSEHCNSEGADDSHTHGSIHVSSTGDKNTDATGDQTMDESKLDEEPTTTGATIQEPGLTAAIADDGTDDNADGSNDGTADAISTPQPPELDMRFDSMESAREHYRDYSQRKGFSIRVDWSRKEKGDDPDYSKAYFVCTKAGKPHKENEDSQNPQPAVKKRKRNTNPRSGCKAHMYVKKKGAWFYVAGWSDEHNHDMIIKPSLTRFLRAHRKIPAEEKKFLRMLHSCNIPTSRQMQLMGKFYGRLVDVPYIAKDVANQRAKFRSEHQNHDLNDTLAYFEKRKADDKDFFSRIKLDDENRVENIFWVDGPSRRAYKSYSDCISFDTTYLTNRYKMPFAPFIGINNHGLSVQFGCGFVRNELTESFVWLFQRFLEAMDGIAPTNIITDQDFAMRGAIDAVFPAAIHRNCRWHMIQNATEKYGSYMAKHPELLDAFNACVNNSLSPEEFEENWRLMLLLHGEGNNEDLAALYDHRKCWVPAYFMKNFFPFLQTTARSEGFNAVLKRYAEASNSVYEFVHQYAAIQDKILNAENKAEADTALTDPDWWCGNPMEKQMAKAYTRNIFNRFQKEMKKTPLYDCTHLNGYQFELTIIEAPVPHYGYRSYRVFANWDEQLFSCNCCKFERDGMLCCHVMKVMSHLKIHIIPDRYILKRWGWDAEAALGDPSEVAAAARKKDMQPEMKNMMVVAGMRDDFRKIAEVGVKSGDGIRIMKTHLQAMKNDLRVLQQRQEKKAMEAAKEASAMPSHSAPTGPMQPGPSTNSSQPFVQAASNSGSNVSTTQHVENPPRSNTKGRPEKIANKNPLNLSTKKPRKCGFCKSIEHTFAKCEERKRLQGLLPPRST